MYQLGRLLLGYKITVGGAVTRPTDCNSTTPFGTLAHRPNNFLLGSLKGIHLPSCTSI